MSENLRPIKIGGEVSSLEIAQHGNGARIDGGLEVRGTGRSIVANPLITNSIKAESGDDLNIIAEGADINISPGGGNVNLLSGSTTTMDFMVTGATGAGAGIKLHSILDTGDYFSIDTTTHGATTITTVDDDATAAHLTLDVDGNIVLDSASGGFEMHGAGATAKFADMYAGMILGYTAIGIDATLATESLGISFAVTDATHKVSFVAPPSGNVEIAVSVYADQASSGRFLQLGLSDNATYNTLDVTHEHFSAKGDETDEEQLHHEWVITGLTAGTSYEYWLGAKAQSSGAYVLYWGGDVTGKMQPFVMKATALPATIYTG